MRSGGDVNYIPNVPRVFVPATLTGDHLTLAAHRAHYVGTVLRRKAGDLVVVFNGQGDERVAEIAAIGRRTAELRLHERIAPLAESALEVTLLQALAKNDAMDLIVQKSTELGVRSIRAVSAEFSVVRLDATRAERRIEHWRKIAQSACEQSGRHLVPTIESCGPLAEGLAGIPSDALRIVFEPRAGRSLDAFEPPLSAKVCLLVGPEGGFADHDLETIAAAGFAAASLGLRKLRVETAAITACALVQFLWGDLRLA